MTDHTTMKLAMRAYAKTLVVLTTGVTALSATTAGFARAAGSFATDGFIQGMEFTPVGFAKNLVPKMITKVTPQLLEVEGGALVEAATGGRSLTVGLPSTHEFGNIGFRPTVKKTFVEEQYVPGPTKQVTTGPGGQVELTPMYAMVFYLPDNTGDVAASKYGDAFMKLFAPRTPIPLPNGEILRVRWDVGPFPGQLLPAEGGFSAMTCTIPLWILTPNSI